MSTKRLHVGRRMSQAVIHGGIVYLAGQVAQNAAGESVTEQTKDVLDIIDDLLAQAGTDKIAATDRSDLADRHCDLR